MDRTSVWKSVIKYKINDLYFLDFSWKRVDWYFAQMLNLACHRANELIKIDLSEKSWKILSVRVVKRGKKAELVPY